MDFSELPAFSALREETRYLSPFRFLDWFSFRWIEELRDFPKNLSSTEREDLLQLCIRGISNCINMSSCSWTRDGSLNTLVLRSLQQNTRLQELEINGHHNHYYDPLILVNFVGLRKISLIMPSGEVIRMLPSWLAVTGESLRVLSLVCKVIDLSYKTFGWNVLTVLCCYWIVIRASNGQIAYVYSKPSTISWWIAPRWMPEGYAYGRVRYPRSKRDTNQGISFRRFIALVCKNLIHPKLASIYSLYLGHVSI